MKTRLTKQDKEICWFIVQNGNRITDYWHVHRVYSEDGETVLHNADADKSYRDRVAKLAKKGVLVKGSHGYFMVNPEILDKIYKFNREEK